MQNLPPVPSYDEFERRVEEALSGRVKTISPEESQARIQRLMAQITRARVRARPLKLLILAAIAFALFNANAKADEKRSADQKDAYNALVAEYPSTVEIALENDTDRKTWRKFVMTDDPVHIKIQRISANYEGQLSREGPGARLLFKANHMPSNPDDWWAIKVYGEITPSVNCLDLFISTTSKKMVLAYYVPGQ